MAQALLASVQGDPVNRRTCNYIPRNEGTYAALIAVLRHHAVSEATERAFGWRMLQYDGITIIDASTIRDDYETPEEARRAADQFRADLRACGYEEAVSGTWFTCDAGAVAPQQWRANMHVRLTASNW